MKDILKNILDDIKAPKGMYVYLKSPFSLKNGVENYKKTIEGDFEVNELGIVYKTVVEKTQETQFIFIPYDSINYINIYPKAR